MFQYLIAPVITKNSFKYIIKYRKKVNKFKTFWMCFTRNNGYKILMSEENIPKLFNTISAATIAAERLRVSNGFPV